MNDSPADIFKEMQSSKKIIICMDSRLDFDAICSCIILRNYLVNELKKDVTVTFDGELSDSMKKILPKYNGDVSFLKENTCPAKDIDFTLFDLHIFLDSGNIEHICREEKYRASSKIKKINIDHHAGNPGYGDLNYVEPLASCCSVLFFMFKDAKIDINYQLSSIYYLGVLLDSGFFQYNTVTSKDFDMVAELKRNGAMTYEIAYELTSNVSLQDMRYRGLVFSNLVYLPELKLAYSTITCAELHKQNIDIVAVTTSASDLLKYLENVNFVFAVRENPDEDGSFNVSFRSRNENFQVLNYAQKLGGGGHVMAAGGSVLAKNIDEAVEKVIEVVKSEAK